jgi:two-component sensor histidine kinase
MLNELVTNALKHGALKGVEGSIDFSWLAVDDEIIRFKWTETSPNIGDTSAEHKGFGSQILGRIVPMDFQGEADREMFPTGLSYTVSARRDRVGEPRP